MGALLRMLVLAIVACGVWSSSAPPDCASAPEDALDSSAVHVRSVQSPSHLLTLVAGAARERGIEEVHFAFDGISFAPPPGHNEFTHYERLDQDLDRWMEALRVWGPPPGLRAHVFSTLRPTSAEIRPGAVGWRATLRDAVRFAWWEDDAFKRFAPALHWIKRWRARVPRERKAMLVLLAGSLTPERWVGRLSSLRASLSKTIPWRTKLADVGSYWDEEAIGGFLRASGIPLLVVAPEARFEDHHPHPELPSMPWVARPQYPPAMTIDRPRGRAIDSSARCAVRSSA